LAHKELFRFCENIGQGRDFQRQSGREQIFRFSYEVSNAISSYVSTKVPHLPPKLGPDITEMEHGKESEP
jgi:hypothetical protein